MGSTSEDVIAKVIAQRYAVERLLGSGGMGEVYRAHDVVLGRPVALKVLRGRLAADPHFVDRFRAEATNAARLSHPGIVQVFDFGRDEELVYMALELIEGRTLRDLLAEHERLSPEAAAAIASEVCDALEHARRAGIVHRDVKPENILLTPEGRVKVADFGLSRALADARSTQTGTVLGTAAYLAPEQLGRDATDHRSDLYALGIALYEMLTGRVPFAGDTPAAVAYRRLNEDVPAPSELQPEVPPQLDEVVRRATARDPDHRYPNAAAMAAALRSVAAGTAAHALGHHTGVIAAQAHETVVLPQRRTRRRRRLALRRKRLVTLLAIAGLAAIAFPVADRLLSSIPVPPVVELTQERAKAILEDRGFEVDVTLSNHRQVPASRVIEQRPAPGERARRGTRVTLTVSLGPELVQVPDVVNVSFGTAQRRLAQSGFVVARKDAYSDEVAAGKVVAQDPEGRLRIERGETVTLTVSKGVEMIEVPKVGGLEEAAAIAELERAGFAVETDRRYDEAVAAGSVISQSPAEGERAARGSTVTIVVSRGAPPVAVPDLRCMTQRQAADALAARGLEARFSGRGRRVVDQAPAPGERAPRGSAVTAYMGHGAFC